MKSTLWARLSPHHHSGKRLPHHHTSYASLLFLLLITAVLLVGVSLSAGAQDDSGVPGSYGVYAVVPGPVPGAPTITSLTNGQVISSTPVTVAGGCTSGSLVKIFKNEVMAGAIMCDSSSRFSLPVDLFIGTNAVVARGYNATDKAGPDSPTVTVRFVPPGLQSTGTQQFNAAANIASQFFLTAQVYYRGAYVGEKMRWTATITGGKAPYAVSVGWGDGKTDLYSRGTADAFEISHTYEKAGGYKGSFPIIVKATDSTGANAYLQLMGIVSDKSAQPAKDGSEKTGLPAWTGRLSIAWPLLAMAILMVISFMLGEWREKKILAGHGAA